MFLYQVKHNKNKVDKIFICTLFCRLLKIFLISCAFSSRESRNMWGNRCTPLLQQEQDRREIPDSQMLLLSWTGGGNDESGTIVCRRYAWHLPLLLVFPILSPVMQKTAKISTPAALPLVRFIVQGGVGGGGGKVWDFYGPQRLWMLQNWIAHHFRGCSRSCSELKKGIKQGHLISH